MVEHIIAYNADTKERYYYHEISQKLIFLKDLSSKNKLVDYGGNELSVVDSIERTSHFRLKNELSGWVNDTRKSNDMTLEHFTAQEILEKYFSENNVAMELEKSFKEINRRSDNYFEYNGKKYNIEVQQCKYDSLEYKQRTKDYESLGVQVIWIVLVDSLNDIKKSMSKKNLSNGYEYNGNFHLFLRKDKLNLQYFYKSRDFECEEIIKFDITNFSFEDFIDFITCKGSAYNFETQTEIDLSEKILDMKTKSDQLNKNLKNLEESKELKLQDLNNLKLEVDALKDYELKRKNEIEESLQIYKQNQQTELQSLLNNLEESKELKLQDLNNLKLEVDALKDYELKRKNEIEESLHNSLGEKKKEHSKLLEEYNKLLKDLEIKNKEFADMKLKILKGFDWEIKEMHTLNKLHNSAMLNTAGYQKYLTHKIYDKRNKISYEIINLA